MATNWYYRLQDGNESEPVQFRELAGLIRSGKIEPATEVHPEVSVLSGHVDTGANVVGFFPLSGEPHAENSQSGSCPRMA